MLKDFDYRYSKKHEGAPWISGSAQDSVDSSEQQVSEKFSDESARKTEIRAGVKLFQELYAAALAVDSLNKLGENISLPQGIKIEHDRGMPKPRIDFPGRLEDLNADAGVANYRHWLDTNRSRIEKDVKEITAVKKNPYLEIESADIALAPSTVMGKQFHKKAALDSAGRLVEIVDPAVGAGNNMPGRTEIDIDVLKKRFDARRANASDPDSDVLVDLTVQAQRGRFGYDLLNENVGAPMALEQRRYKADDLVFYGGKLVPARTLPGAAVKDNFVMAAGKTLDIALDSAMIYLGLSKLAKLNLLRPCSQVVKAELPSAAEAIAPGISGKSLGIAAAYAATETTMGALGFIANNKWGDANASWINAGRGIYFTGLCLGGLSRRFSNSISGGEALNGKLLETGPNWLHRADRVAETSMLASLPVQVGTVAYSTYEQLRRTLEHSRNDKAPNPAILAEVAARALSGARSAE